MDFIVQNEPKDAVEVVGGKGDSALASDVDIGKDQDLAVGLMNLISIEEHLFFSYAKTGDLKHLDLLDEVRQVRKKMMAKIVKNPKGEEHCISKHLLAASMRFSEVGTKELQAKGSAAAKEFFDASFALYSAFMAINKPELEEKKDA